MPIFGLVEAMDVLAVEPPLCTDQHTAQICLSEATANLHTTCAHRQAVFQVVAGLALLGQAPGLVAMSEFTSTRLAIRRVGNHPDNGCAVQDPEFVDFLHLAERHGWARFSI
jgi:hypothetical protein